MAIRVVVADDCPLLLQALEDLLASQEDMEVIGICRDGKETLDAVMRLSPDVLLLDLTMLELDGLALSERLRSEQILTRVVVFTANMDKRRALEYLRLGVSGVVLLKKLPPKMLLEAIKKAASGEVWLDDQSYGQAVAMMLCREETERELAALLTPREMDILRLAARGQRNRDIAEELRVAEGTVKLHLHRVFEKLGLRGRSDLIAYAHRNGLV